MGLAQVDLGAAALGYRSGPCDDAADGAETAILRALALVAPASASASGAAVDPPQPTASAKLT